MFHKTSALPLTRVVVFGARRCFHSGSCRWNVSTKGPCRSSHTGRTSYFSTSAMNLSELRLPSMKSLLSTNDAAAAQPVAEPSPLDKIMLDVRQKLARGSLILPSVFDEIKDVLKKEPALTPDDALQLMKMCGARLPDMPKSERTKTAHALWKHFEKQRLQRDTRLCNALLTAHLDNEHKYSPKEFLAWMRSVGIEADADTFSLFIRRYCDDADIGEATATLGVMQARGMSISHPVFNSLIRCYSAIGEVEEANKVMDAMRGGGLKIRGDTHSALIEGLVRSGRKWDDVREVLVNLLNTPSVFIGSGDMFDIFMALVRAKDFVAAKDLLTVIASQPKQKGYSRIVRGVIPQAIFEGAAELAHDIFSTAEVQKGGELKTMFIFRALLVMEVKPDVIVRMIEKLLKGFLDPDRSNEMAMKVIQMSIQMDKLKYAKELGVVLRHKFKTQLGNHDVFNNFFIRQSLEKKKDPVEQILFIMAIHSAGIRPSISSLALDVVPALFAAHQEEGEDPTFMLAILSDTLSSVSPTKPTWHEMANALVQFLLNKETRAGFDEALHFIFNDKFLVWPSMWHASLARAYLATGHTEGLVDVILKSAIVHGDRDGRHSFNKSKRLKSFNPFQPLHNIHINAHMYKPKEDPDRVLLPALRALQKARIGLPRESVEKFRSTVKDPETLRVLQILHEMDFAMADYWTWTRVVALNKQLVRKYAESKDIQRAGAEPRVTACRVSDKSLAKMEQLQRRLREVGHEQWIQQLTAKIAIAYIERGDTDKGLKMVRDRLGPSFPRLPEAMDALVMKLIDQGRLDDAIDISLDVISKGSVIHFVTFKAMATALMDSNRYEGAKHFILAAAKGVFLLSGSSLSQNIVQLIWHQEKGGDVEKVREMIDFLVTKGFLDGKETYAYSGLVNVQLIKGDLEAAVDTFEQLVERHKTLPMHAHLIRALIEAEDMENMQRMIDICASSDFDDEGGFYYNFAMHLLVMGKDSAAENLLNTPGLPNNYSSVKFVCTRLAEDGNLEALKKFNTFTRGVHGIDREYIYTKMIVAAVDDLGALTEILEDMWSEGFRPNRSSRNIVTMAFRSADQPVPRALLT